MDELTLREYENGLRACWGILASLNKGDGLGTPDLGNGHCFDCGNVVHVRWSLVSERCCLALCRPCRSSRRRVAQKLGLPESRLEEVA